MNFIDAILLSALLIGATLSSPGNASADTAPTTLIVVRHAEKPGMGDALSDAGNERARMLAHMLMDSGVTAIYHSNTHRTRLTAEPTATALGITPTEYPATQLDALVKEVLKTNAGGAVLIVGHSNTITRIVEIAGGPAMPELSEASYDRFFVITVHADGRTSFVSLRYGAETP